MCPVVGTHTEKDMGSTIKRKEKDTISQETNCNREEIVLQTHINFPRFLPIFSDFLEQLSHLAPIY